MALPPIAGHEALRARFSEAIQAGRLPQTLLFEGPRGVGKQRLALWLAQALLCEMASAPCGKCPSCRRVDRLSHPDLHWFIPVELTKKGADADKQIDLVEEAIGEVLAERREEPFYQAPAGLAAHSMASARLLLRRLALKPAQGPRAVFILGDAERLAAQKGQEGAANAVLKALEEPPPTAFIVLTTSEPDALLPTILSRTVRVRVGRVPDSVVTAFVHQHMLSRLGDAANAARRIQAADGAIGRLAATEGSEGEGAAAADRLLQAVRSGTAARYGAALAQPPFQARGAFTAMLDALLERLRDEARQGGDTGKVMAAMTQVLEARELAQGNVNPQLLTAVLTEDLAGGGRS
jgi:DNA polymerase-3 subunit delta'